MARRPLDQLVGRVLVREVGHEPRAVEVRVHLDLEVGLRAFAREPERVVERRLVLDHRAEHHLVVAALRAPEAGRHPRVDEDGDPFRVPPRRRDARRRQVEVEDRLRLLVDRIHLPEEQLAERQVASRRAVHRRHVHQLVVGDHQQPFVRRQRLEQEVERRHLDLHRVARDRRRPGVAVVLEVEDQDRRLLARRELEQLLVEGERVEDGLRRVGREKRQRRVDVDDAGVSGLDFGQLCRRRQRAGDEQRQNQ